MASPSSHNHPVSVAQVLVEYVWLGSSGSDLRSKTRVLDTKPSCVDEVPMIVVDGRCARHSALLGICAGSVLTTWSVLIRSSYGLAPEEHDVFLKPRKLFKDPFRQGDHLLVLCDSFMATVSSFSGLDREAVIAKPSDAFIFGCHAHCRSASLRGFSPCPSCCRRLPTLALPATMS